MWKTFTLLGVLVFLVVSSAFVMLGRLNADEGWYLYASKLVYAGKFPYRDFAYTQTPLLPYIYGLPQLIARSNIYAGRATSVLISTAALLASLVFSKRHGGWASTGLTSWLWATFTYGIYFQSITKTYALTTLFFVLTVSALYSRPYQQHKPVFASLFVVLATLTRLSALLFAIPVIIHALVTSERKIKLAVSGLCVVGVSWVLMLSVPNPEVAVWNLIGHHMGQWGNISFAEKIRSILGLRIVELLLTFPAQCLLILAIMMVGRKTLRVHAAEQPGSIIAVLGLFFFGLPQLGTGGFHTEYFVPFFFAMFPIIAIWSVWVLRRSSAMLTRVIIKVAILTSLVLGIARGGAVFLDDSSGSLPVEEVESLASLVEENTFPEDEIFALEALWVAVEANRMTLPNLAMAQFSFFEGDAAKAEQLKLIDGSLALDYVSQRRPKIVVLTDLDWRNLSSTTYAEAIAVALSENYELQIFRSEFGQRRGEVKVYVRRTHD